MNGVRIGELFAGYGGLGMGVQAALGGEVAWVSEFDKGANKILAHRFPDVPNHGDITKIDWSQVEPVDILTGGSPCQDLSHAGKRQGMTEGTRSNLWVAMREAIAQLRPGLVVWENVRGAGSAEATSDLEQQPGLLAGVRRRPGQPVLRALGRVVGDLADLGYVGQVRGLRAADVGAPHERFRYFLAAYPDSEGRGGVGWQHAPQRNAHGRGGANGLRSTGEPTALLPTPRTSDTNGAGRYGEGGLDLRTAVALLPTPTTQDAANTGGPSQYDRNTIPLNAVQDWGQYADAIHRWEALTRPAPPPTETGPKGNPRLSPAFSEWMQGLPAGWVTDVPGTRNEALKALGNGVCPAQCEAALRVMLDHLSEAVA